MTFDDFFAVIGWRNAVKNLQKPDFCAEIRPRRWLKKIRYISLTTCAGVLEFRPD
jgi:hypothetical protein